MKKISILAALFTLSVGQFSFATSSVSVSLQFAHQISIFDSAKPDSLKSYYTEIDVRKMTMSAACQNIPITIDANGKVHGELKFGGGGGSYIDNKAYEGSVTVSGYKHYSYYNYIVKIHSNGRTVTTNISGDFRYGPEFAIGAQYPAPLIDKAEKADSAIVTPVVVLNSCP